MGSLCYLLCPSYQNQNRRFLRIKTDDGQQLYFRYYDPRVLSIFLPTCDASQLQEFFGPVNQFIIEDPTRQRTLLFTQQHGSLQTTARSAIITY